MPRKKKTDNNYFGEIEEQAVIDYIITTDGEEKNRIYQEILKPAFNKMIESIIRRYKLFPHGEDFKDTLNDTLSFLMTKMDKFKPGVYKAYSYYGTICKHYLIGRLENHDKSVKRNPSYEEISSSLVDNIRYTSGEDKGAKIAKEAVSMLVERIDNMLANPEKYSMKESEIKLGKAIINLFENWDYVLSTDKTNKLNKNAVLLFLRENTNMEQKDIRDNLKKFKKEFYAIKDIIIN